MTPIVILAMGAACGYLTGNPQARNATFKQLQKMFGMAIDSLNKQGGNYVHKPESTAEQPQQPEQPKE